MERYHLILLVITASVLITNCSSYFDYRGDVIIRVMETADEELVETYSFDCYYATFSALINTSSLPFYYIGTSCNDSEVRSRLANVTVPNGFIALAERGSCYFTTKTEIAVNNNAKGLVVYNIEDTSYPFVMGSSSDYLSPIAVVSVSLKSGQAMLQLMSVLTLAAIDNTQHNSDGYNTYSQITFSIFIGLTCIVLLVVLIALFLTIYQLWCRCFNIWKRTQQKQEANRAVKRKLHEMKCSRYSVGDTTSVDGLHDSCSVCLDEFMSGDVIRTLPCTHPFHKDCVDKWLYKKHTCPLCKFDILKGEHEDTSEDTAPEMLETNQEETVTTTTSTTSTITTLNVREGGRPDSAEHEDIQVSISSDELLVPLIGKDDVKSV